MEGLSNDTLVGHVCDLIQAEVDTEGGWLAIGFLSILFITAVVAALIYLWGDLQTNSICSLSVPKLFYTFLFGFILVRIALCFLCSEMRTRETSTVRFVLHRFSPVFLCTSFTAVLFYWIDLYHQNYFKHRAKADTLSRKLFWGFTIFNGVIWLKSTVMCLLILDTKVDKGLVIEFDMIIMGLIDLLLCIGFLGYGLSLYWRTSHAKEVHSAAEGQEIKKILAVTFIFTVCFLLRMAMEIWLFSSTQGSNIPRQPTGLLFDFFLWRLPEIIPAFAEIFVVYTSTNKTLRDTQYIEDLYRQSNETMDDEDPTNSLLLEDPAR